MLRENRSVQSLNIESNFISSTGLMAVLKAVRENATLTELRVDNQVSPASPRGLAFRGHSPSLLPEAAAAGPGAGGDGVRPILFGFAPLACAGSRASGSPLRLRPAGEWAVWDGGPPGSG